MKDERPECQCKASELPQAPGSPTSPHTRERGTDASWENDREEAMESEGVYRTSYQRALKLGSSGGGGAPYLLGDLTSRMSTAPGLLTPLAPNQSLGHCTNYLFQLSHHHRTLNVMIYTSSREPS